MIIHQATPHAVRGTSMVEVSRQTFAVFMEPNFDELMNCPEGVDESETQSQSSARNLPPGVPSLASRWNSRQTFADFTKATLSSYY
jgi:isopenicillin N synthase-like dioxygenase